MRSVGKVLLAAMFLLNLAACSVSHEMTVVKDCTGTYLQEGEKDYHVCNTDKTDSFSPGAKVEVSFKKVEKCYRADSAIVCMMFHANEGFVKIKKIK